MSNFNPMPWERKDEYNLWEGFNKNDIIKQFLIDNAKENMLAFETLVIQSAIVSVFVYLNMYDATETLINKIGYFVGVYLVCYIILALLALIPRMIANSVFNKNRTFTVEEKVQGDHTILKVVVKDKLGKYYGVAIIGLPLLIALAVALFLTTPI